MEIEIIPLDKTLPEIITSWFEYYGCSPLKASDTRRAIRRVKIWRIIHPRLNQEKAAMLAARQVMLAAQHAMLKKR